MPCYFSFHVISLSLRSGAFSNSRSRKLADPARLPTPRYLIRMRVYECRFPRMKYYRQLAEQGHKKAETLPRLIRSSGGGGTRTRVRERAVREILRA